MVFVVCVISVYMVRVVVMTPLSLSIAIWLPHLLLFLPSCYSPLLPCVLVLMFRMSVYALVPSAPEPFTLSALDTEGIWYFY